METTPELAQYQSDHDLLIRIDERTKGMHDQVNKLTGDHETRIRDLEKKGDRYIGRQSVVGILISCAFALLCAVISTLQLHW